MAHPDLNELLNARLPFAQAMLSEHGEFFPFGGYMDRDGGILPVAGWTGEEQPRSQAVIDVMVGGLRERVAAGEIRASAIGLDVRTIPPGEADKTDAICTRLEHANGEAVEVYLPYTKNAEGEYEYGELFAARGEPGVFRPSGGDA